MLKQVHEKQEILVGFEQTGHYGMNLATFLTHYGIPFVTVNPMHVNRSKELDEKRPLGCARHRTFNARWTLQLPKAKQLVEVVESSIGLKEGLVMAHLEIATLLAQHNMMQAQLGELTAQLTELAKQMTDYDYLASVPDIGDVTIVDLLLKVGSLAQYTHPRQLIKLARLTLRENSSSQQIGQKRISKRGRGKLRALLFRVMMPVILHNSAFKVLHEYYITRAVNQLRKKQSIVVLCG